MSARPTPVNDRLARLLMLDRQGSPDEMCIRDRPYTKAMIVTSRMTRVISNGLIWVVLLWIPSTLQMQSSGKGV